jgi:hypothetical protein
MIQKGEIGYTSRRNLEPIIDCKHPIIASGATPIGTAGRAPDRKIIRKYFLQVGDYGYTRRNFDPIFE